MYSIHSRRDRQFGGAFYQFHRLNMYALSTDRNTLFTGPRIQHLQQIGNSELPPDIFPP